MSVSPHLERLIIAMEDAGATAVAPTIDVFFALDEGAPRSEVARMLAELRAAGLAVDTDYAGRSLKGQHTQAARLARTASTVVVGWEAVLRRPGQADEPLALADIVGRLFRMSWRDIMCGELREEHVGTRKTLSGWAARDVTTAGLSSSISATAPASRSS